MNERRQHGHAIPTALIIAALLSWAAIASAQSPAAPPSRDAVLAAMKKATTFMAETVAYRAATSGT